MQLTDINVIKDIMQRHGFNFSKGLGQNFLINPSVCPRMAEACGADDTCGVLEIGPGIGVLTAELAKTADKVVTIELDKRLIPVLDETLSEFDNVTVIEGDVLKLDLNKIISEHFQNRRVFVCANLPYYITSPVIMTLLESRLPIEAITVMVQQEAAQRLTAPLGTRRAGAVTAAVRYFAEPELLFKVKSGSFMPAPKVDSAVIKLNVLKQPPVTVKDQKLMFRMIKSAFAQRRKTILNSLSSGIPADKQTIAAALERSGIPQTARAEQLTLEQFADICNNIEL